MKLKLKFIENNPGLIDSPSEKILGLPLFYEAVM